MTVMDALRSARARPGLAPGDETGSRLPPWASALLTGALTALVSVAVVLVPTLLAWSTAARSSGSVPGVLSVGCAVWLIAQGAHLHVTGGTVALVPLGLWTVLTVVTAYGAFRVVRHRPPDETRGPGPLPRTATVALGQWWAGYAAVTGVAAILAGAGPAAPVWWSLVHPVLVLPALSAVIGVTAQGRHEADLVDPALAQRLVPDVVRRAMRPALRGLGTLVGVGALAVLGVVGWHLGDVRHVQAELGAGLLGGLVLTTAQLAVLPNLALWAVSFLAGPGFQVVDGARTTLTGSQSGLMPMVPVFAALPQPGDFPVVLLVLVCIPVLVGGVIGHRALGAVARLASLRAKLSVAATSALLTAGLVGLLDAFAGGRLGTYKLAQVGAPALSLTVALAVELVLGAVVVVVWDAWRLRR